MNDLRWTPSAGKPGVNLPATLARKLGYTELTLRYNTGRSIAENGREFAAVLENLIEQWPVPVEELVLLGHSMGGLVSRSACHYACESGHRWPERLRRMVFLGTPHHGPPVERAGHLLEQVLEISPYSAPFNRLGAIRSAGITDLRHGRIIIRYQLKTPYRDGTTHVIFEPLGKLKAPDEAQGQTLAERRAAMTWAQRLKRVFNIDIETCGECGGAMKVIACTRDCFVHGLLAFGKPPHRYRLR